MTDLAPGHEILASIEKPAAGGRMIARVGGQVVLVAGAIPGEDVVIRIDRVGKDVAYGTAILVERRSADRVDLSIDPACGGCLYSHIAYARQLALKGQVIADALSRIGRVTWTPAISVASSPTDGYRMRARLHVRHGDVGFFREGTHELCDARATGQLLPAALDAVEGLVATVSRAESAVSGVVELAENVEATERVAHLDLSPKSSVRALPSGALSAGLTGITVSREGAVQPTLLAGSQYVVDRVRVDGVEVRFQRHGLAFFQGNRFLLERLAAHVIAHVPARSRVVDLYAGTGLFAISAAVVRDADVTAVEGDPLSAIDLHENSRAANGRVTVMRESVEAFARRRLHASQPVDLLIVDPPRTGMSREGMTGAIDLRARTVVYVSCDVATFARDARRLVDAGYVLRTLDAFDLFPNTPHVESVAVFDRS